MKLLGKPRWESDFIDFFHQHRRLYVRIAYTITGDWQTAEDASQDAFATIYDRWTRIRESPGAFGRTVLVNASLRIVRRGKPESTVAYDLDAVETAAVAGVDGASDLRLDLSAALASLSPQHRAVVALRYLHDLPVAEVARTLRIPEGTVKSQCARAMEVLRRRLADGDPADRESRPLAPAIPLQQTIRRTA